MPRAKAAGTMPSMATTISMRSGRNRARAAAITTSRCRPWALRLDPGKRAVHVRPHLEQCRLAQDLGAQDLDTRPRDLALVPIEDAKWDAEAKTDRILRTDPLVLGAGA